jgi:hypothetical protein
LADLAVVRAQPQLFGSVASDPTVSRLIGTLAADAEQALAALRAARAAARERAWSVRPPVEPTGPLVIDLDATIVLAHSEKEGATPTWKRTFGFHPLLAFLDHGPGGTGEYVGGLLRTGKATANDAADHIAVLTNALAQLPAEQRCRVLVRGDSGAGVHQFPWHLHELGSHYSVGLYAHQPIVNALAVLPRQAWRAAIEPDGQPREGAQVAELTRYLRPSRSPWPPGMRVIARRERPHPGAQLRLTDADGWRITLFATNVTGGRIAEHELLHRQRARGPHPLHQGPRPAQPAAARLHRQPDLARVLALAHELLAWTQHLALTDSPARSWEPRRLRLRLLNIAGRVVRSGRREHLRLPRGWPWADDLLAGHRRLDALTN